MPNHAGGRELLVRDAMELDARAGAGDEGAVGAAEVERAGREQQTLATGCFELAPRFIRSPDERHVRRIVPVCGPNDSRVAVSGSTGVRRSESVEPQNSPAAAGELIGSRTAHRAESGNDHIVRWR